MSLKMVTIPFILRTNIKSMTKYATTQRLLFRMIPSNFKVLNESTEFCNMSLGLIVLIAMQNLAAIQSAVLEKMTFEVAFLGVIFRIFPNWNFHFRSRVWKAGCDVVSMYVLQSYRSCGFLSVTPEASCSFGLNLQLHAHSQIIMK